MTGSVWKLLPLVSAAMPYQMALDEVLFREMERERATPLLRFYFSSEPFVTLGYFSKETEPNSCRRLTGGGRVEHGKDLIFSLIAHKSADESFGSVQGSYHKIHEAVRRGFELLGQKADFYQPSENLPKGEDCFVYPIASDLKMNGRKIAGGAQKRSSGVLLHHESIQLPEAVAAKELCQQVRCGFEKTFDILFESANWDPEILAQAKQLSRNGYEPGNYERTRKLFI